MTDGKLREQIKQLAVYKAATNFHEQYRPDKSNLARFQANWIDGVLYLIKQNFPQGGVSSPAVVNVTHDSSIPDDTSLEDIYHRCDVSNNRTDNPMSLEEFKAAIHQQHEAEVLEARKTELDIYFDEFNNNDFTPLETIAYCEARLSHLEAHLKQQQQDRGGGEGKS